MKIYGCEMLREETNQWNIANPQEEPRNVDCNTAKPEILTKIHRMVIAKFRYVSDEKQYGISEKWVMPKVGFDGSQRIVGDCEDFALAVRKLVRDHGITNSRLLFCITKDGVGHLVLEVNGWILDNRYGFVVSRDYLEKKGYEWVAISGYNSGDNWHNIAN